MNNQPTITITSDQAILWSTYAVVELMLDQIIDRHDMALVHFFSPFMKEKGAPLKALPSRTT